MGKGCELQAVGNEEDNHRLEGLEGCYSYMFLLWRMG